MSCCVRTNIWENMTRRKRLKNDLLDTPLKRCLSWWQLTFVGIGQMAGAGVYVLTGAVALTASGPATFISYILAGICALLSALSFAEFGARCPKAGSVYTYVYVTIGEFAGFIIGWMMLLEYSIGVASTARAWGGTVNALSGDRIKNWTLTEVGSFDLLGSTQYPDFMALLIVLICMAVVMLGTEESVSLTIIVIAGNLLTVLFITSVGFYVAKLENLEKPDGFMPFGITGVLRGSAMSFYGYEGYNAIAMASEEAKDPVRALPIANILSVTIVMLMYVVMSLSLTLTVPYNQIVESAPFSFAFLYNGLDWASTVVTLGSLVAITSTTIAGVFALPRLAYSMADDGLLYKFMAYVNPRTKTPIISILVFSILSAVAAFLFDVKILAEIVSLGSLFSAFVLNGCLIILRYEPKDSNHPFETTDENDETGSLKPVFKSLKILHDPDSGRVTRLSTMFMGLCLMIFSAILVNGSVSSGGWRSWILGLFLVVSGVAAVGSFCILYMHIQNDTFTSYKMPLAPFLPAANMLTLSMLSVGLGWLAWLRFFIWTAIGSVVYFTYSLHNSVEVKSSITSAKHSGNYNTLTNDDPSTEDETSVKNSTLHDIDK